MLEIVFIYFIAPCLGLLFIIYVMNEVFGFSAAPSFFIALASVLGILLLQSYATYEIALFAVSCLILACIMAVLKKRTRISTGVAFGFSLVIFAGLILLFIVLRVHSTSSVGGAQAIELVIYVCGALVVLGLVIALAAWAINRIKRRVNVRVLNQK